MDYALIIVLINKDDMHTCIHVCICEWKCREWYGSQSTYYL